MSQGLLSKLVNIRQDLLASCKLLQDYEDTILAACKDAPIIANELGQATENIFELLEGVVIDSDK